MLPLGEALRRRGYRSFAWNYPSWNGTIQQHGNDFRRFLLTEIASERRVHVVAHSMGSIVVRSALASTPVQNLERVVFLAPPNHGCPIASRVKRWAGPMFRTIADVSNDRGSFVNQLPLWDQRDLGVIAARFDLLVPVSSTHLGHESDHVVLNATHNSLLFSTTAMQYTVNFLKSGRFCAVQ
jgi:pimeloyl-ACP methyl ester carboxylesterase